MYRIREAGGSSEPVVELWVSVSGAVDDGNYGPEKWPGEFIEQRH